MASIKTFEIKADLLLIICLKQNYCKLTVQNKLKPDVSYSYSSNVNVSKVNRLVMK